MSDQIVDQLNDVDYLMEVVFNEINLKILTGVMGAVKKIIRKDTVQLYKHLIKRHRRMAGRRL